MIYDGNVKLVKLLEEFSEFVKNFFVSDCVKHELHHLEVDDWWPLLYGIWMKNDMI